VKTIGPSRPHRHGPVTARAVTRIRGIALVSSGADRKGGIAHRRLYRKLFVDPALPPVTLARMLGRHVGGIVRNAWIDLPPRTIGIGSNDDFAAERANESEGLLHHPPDRDLPLLAFGHQVTDQVRQTQTTRVRGRQTERADRRREGADDGEVQGRLRDVATPVRPPPPAKWCGRGG